VRIRHQEIVIPDPGITSAAARSTMDIHVFTKNIVLADRQECFFAFEFQILGIQTDCRKRIEAIAFTNLRRPLDHDMRFESAFFSSKPRMAPACAIDSIVNTPGMTGVDGKWPLKNGSLIVTFFSATIRLSGSTSRTRSTRRNGYRCGRIRMISAIRSSFTYFL